MQAAEVYMNIVAYYCFSCVRANTMLWCDLLLFLLFETGFMMFKPCCSFETL